MWQKKNVSQGWDTFFSVSLDAIVARIVVEPQMARGRRLEHVAEEPVELDLLELICDGPVILNPIGEITSHQVGTGYATMSDVGMWSYTQHRPHNVEALMLQVIPQNRARLDRPGLSV